MRAQWNSSPFWLVAFATGAMVFVAALTRAVDIPINNQLMTWSVASPPDNAGEIWSRWEKAHSSIGMELRNLMADWMALSKRGRSWGNTIRLSTKRRTTGRIRK
jgi:hypothetical protein